MTTEEIRSLIDKLNRGFEEFKSAHDQSLRERDVLIDEKIDRISAALDDVGAKVESIETASGRLGAPATGDANAAYAEAFYNSFVRQGDEAVLNDIRADLSVGVPSEGGVTIPEELDRNMLVLAEEISPMRRECTVRQIGGANYRKLVREGGVGSGWVGEKDPRPGTPSPSFSELTPTMGEVYAEPAATQTMLDDAFFDVQAMLEDEGNKEFVRQENLAFVAGDGVNKPVGLLTAPVSAQADDQRPFGTVQALNTGVAADLPAGAAAYDLLMDLTDELNEYYQSSAIFMTHRKTRTQLRKIKDANGNYVWQEAVAAGQPATLLGYRVVTNPNFPVVAANAIPIAFGDFRQAFYIVDRLGTTMMRDPYTNKPFVKFYMTRRVGSMIVNTEAIKFVKVAL